MTAFGVAAAVVLAAAGALASVVGVYRPAVLEARRDERGCVVRRGDDLACGGADPAVVVPGDRS